MQEGSLSSDQFKLNDFIESEIFPVFTNKWQEMNMVIQEGKPVLKQF